MTGDGVLFPALVIGLGGLGLQVLQQLRANLHDRCGPADFLPQLRLLYIDTDPEVGPQATEGPANAVLEEREVLIARLNRPSHYLKTVRNRATLDSWLNLAMICRLPRNQVTTEGLRILGRLGLVDNYRTVVCRLRSDLEACVNPKATECGPAADATGHPDQSASGLRGGRAGRRYRRRHVHRRGLHGPRAVTALGYQNLEVVGLFLLPSAEGAGKKSPALGNAFAALTELHHFSSPEAGYQAFFDDSEDPIQDSNAPFDRRILLPLPPEDRDPTPTRTVTAFAGDFLCRELIGALGRKAEEARAALSDPNRGFGAGLPDFRFATVYRAPTGHAGAGRELVRHSPGSELDGAGSHDDPGGGRRAAGRSRLRESTCRPRLCSARLSHPASAGLQRPPEAQFQAILQRCFGQSGDVQPAADSRGAGRIGAVAGPTHGRFRPDRPRRRFESGRSIPAARTGPTAGRLPQWTGGRTEVPGRRGGGSVPANRDLSPRSRPSPRCAHRDLLARAADAHTHIHGLVCNLQRGSWWPGRKSKTGAELREALEEFPKLRYECLVLEQVLDLYRGLLEDLPKRQEELTFARERLGQFLQLLREDLAPPGGAKVNLGPGRHFFPGGCRTFDEAIDSLLRSVKPEALEEIDQKTQLLIRRQFRSLLQLCLGPGAAFKDLWSALALQTSAVVDGLLGKASAAAIYLKEQTNETMVGSDLTTAFDDATPKLAGRRPTSPEIRLLVVPADLAGERLGQLAKGAVKGVDVLAVAGTEDVYFYREQARLLLADLPQLGLLAEEAYRQMTASGYCTAHTRMDVTHWLQPG